MISFLRAATLAVAGFGVLSGARAQDPDRDFPRSVLQVQSVTASSDLTLEAALDLALKFNPALRGAASEIEAREAFRRQAGRFTNPELFAEVEDVAGTGPLRGTRSAEVTAGLSQSIPLGGDRRANKRIATSVLEAGRFQLEVLRLDIRWWTKNAFLEVLAGQTRLSLADSLHRQATRFYEIVASRADAGKVSPLEAQRASIERSTTAIALTKATRELSALRTRLAAAWGDSEPQFTKVSGTLDSMPVLSDLDRAARGIAQSPDVGILRAVVDETSHGIALVRATRIPDLTISVGGRRSRELGASAWTAGLSFPIPVFNSQRDAVDAARARVNVAESEMETTLVSLNSRLNILVSTARATREEIEELEDRALPAARQNLLATVVGYQEGKFSLITVLDAQRTLSVAANQAVDAHLDYQLLLAEIERISAQATNRTTK